MSAFKRLENHTLYLDFDEFTDYRVDRERDGYIAFQLVSVLGPRRRFPTPGHLQAAVDDYFTSCLGPIYTKTGFPILDSDGQPVIKVVRPYTVSGLARAIGVTTQALRNFKYATIMSGIPDEYLPILNEARQRIEEYSETRLYDNDGSKGAQFALAAAFGWETPRERSDRLNNTARTKIQKQESAAKLNALENGAGDGSGINITIIRAGRADDMAAGDSPANDDTDDND